MRSRNILTCAVACALGLLLATPAFGVLSSGNGQVDFRLYDFFNSSNDLVATYPVGYPESMTRSQTGVPSAGGFNEVTYELLASYTGAILDVAAVATTEPAGNGGGGKAALAFTFVADEAFNYDFRALVERAPHGFVANFAGIEASAYYDQLGNLTGTFPTINDPGGTPIDFDEFVNVGTLPAGTYTFTVEAFSSLGRSGDPLNTGGAATLTIVPVPEPMTGILVLMGMAALSVTGRRRSTRDR